MNILLEIRNSYLDPTKLDTNLPAHKRKLFSRQEERKNVMLFDGVAKKSLLLKNPKNPFFADSVGNQMRRVSWIISKFSTEMPDTGSPVTQGLKILNDFLVETRELRSQGGTKNTLFSYFFDHLETHLISITPRTGKKVER